ncbi:MAG: DUF4153 domain-containing protein [Prevotellaceae bacterium]|jgi:hypothetical protein|nr:DUF4153 domain-containing protein [Prevotellaceae bacterium]
MKKIHFRNLQGRAIDCLQAHQVEAILGIFFFMLYIVGRYTDIPPTWLEHPSSTLVEYQRTTPLEYMQWFFPTLFVLSYCANTLFRNQWRPLYYASLLLLIPLVLLRNQLEPFCESSAYPYTLLLTILLLWGHRRTKGNASFACHSIEMLSDAAFSFVIGALMMGAISAIYFSVTYIFDLSGWTGFIQDVWMFILYVIIPLLFCYFRQEASVEADNAVLSPGLQILLNFILSPAVIIYTAILYLYALTILIRWELPKGGIAYMVMAFMLFTLAGRMSQLIVSRRYYDWFYRRFSYLAIPPLILFWTGTAHRIAEYSFTEQRVYLLAAGVLMTLSIFFLLSKRWGNYRLMLLMSAVVIALLTYIPGISARSIGIAAQKHRLETLARGLELWNDTTSRLTGTATFQTTDSLMFYRATQLNDCYYYLKKEQGEKQALALYGKNELDLDKFRIDDKGTVILVEKDADKEYKYYRCPPISRRTIEAYKYYLEKFTIETIGDSVRVTIEVPNGLKILLEESLQSHLAPYDTEIVNAGKAFAQEEAFILKNDSCMVILDGFTRDKDGRYEAYSEGKGFLK